MLMMSSVDKSKVATEDMEFKPVKSWMGNEKVEKVDGWKAHVYEATAKMRATYVVRRSAYHVLGSFQDYLDAAAKVKENEVMPVDLMSIDSMSSGQVGGPPSTFSPDAAEVSVSLSL